MSYLHEVQLKILEGLLFSVSAKYSDLKPLRMENSQFVFHLKQLIKNGLVAKSGLKYGLTSQGKEFANRITTENLTITQQAKVTTVLSAYKTDGKDNSFLLYKRLN
jgi:hypothetical protein